MPLSQDIIDVVADVNLKYMGELHVAQLGQTRENSVNHLSRLDRLSEGFIGRILLDFAQPDSSEAMADKARLTGDSIAEKALSLAGSVAAAQVMTKGAGNTPPVTP